MARMLLSLCNNTRSRYLNRITLQSLSAPYAVKRCPAVQAPVSATLCCARCAIIRLHVLEPSWAGVLTTLQATYILQSRQRGRYSPPITTLSVG